jgi:phosphomannomutase
MSKIFFGTDGWRARIDEEIHPESVAAVAQAFAAYVLKEAAAKPKVAVGYDTRRRSRDFAELFARVLSGNGIDVILSDRVVPTPVLSYTVVDRECFAGVMITASHNPPCYNGIKFKAAYGGPFSLEQTRAVEALLYTSETVVSESVPASEDLLPPYVAHIESRIDFGSIRYAGLRVLADSMGGAGGTLIADILAKNGCTADTIYGKPAEDFYGRLPEPVASNLNPLGEALHAGSYALGVATDGDADRLGVCLETGDFLSAQTTILLLVDYLKRVRHEPGAIVHTSSVTGLLRKHFLSPDTPVYDVQVGFKYITDIMVRERVCFGGEESGGFGYAMHLPERDGIFSALLFLEMLSVSGCRTLSAYVTERESRLGRVHYARIDTHCDRPDRENLLPRLHGKKVPSVAGFRVISEQTFLSSRGIVNGIKYVLEGDCRWLLIRASETEPILRYYAEGQDDEEVRSLLSAGPAL